MSWIRRGILHKVQLFFTNRRLFYISSSFFLDITISHKSLQTSVSQHTSWLSPGTPEAGVLGLHMGKDYQISKNGDAPGPLGDWVKSLLGEAVCLFFFFFSFSCILWSRYPGKPFVFFLHFLVYCFVRRRAWTPGRLSEVATRGSRLSFLFLFLVFLVCKWAGDSMGEKFSFRYLKT